MSNIRTRPRLDKREMRFSDLIKLLDGQRRIEAESAFSAIEERLRIRKKNAPILKENQRRRELNRQLWDSLSAKYLNESSLHYYYKKLLNPMVTMKYRLDRFHEKTLATLERYRQAAAGVGCQGMKPCREYANAKTPEDWNTEIRKIADPIARSSVACIVWWDFFSQRVRSNGQEQWTHLNDLLDDFREHPSVISVVNALIDCGYHPFDAVVRVTGGEWHR